VSPEQKSFLLRIDPRLWSEIERLAATDLRSVNAQVEFLLREVGLHVVVKLNPTLRL